MASSTSSPYRRGRYRRWLLRREVAVLQLMAAGATVTSAANVLGLSPEDVRYALRRAYWKLGAASRAHAVALALQRGLIDAPAPSGL